MEKFFSEVSKIKIYVDRVLKIILLNIFVEHKNNYVRNSNMSNIAKNFDILATSLNVLIILIV